MPLLQLGDWKCRRQNTTCRPEGCSNMLTDASGKLYPLATGEGEVLPCIRPAWQARPQVDMPRDAKRLQPDLQLATAHGERSGKRSAMGSPAFLALKNYSIPESAQQPMVPFKRGRACSPVASSSGTCERIHDTGSKQRWQRSERRGR